MGATSSIISGERLVNFDTNVVAPNNGVLAYSHSSNTCTLVCHQITHNADGTVQSSAKKSKVKGK
jgi:hypothetical protein